MADDFNPDAFIAQAEAPHGMPQQALPSLPPQHGGATADTGGFDPDAFLADAQQEKYGGTGQQIIAGLEGAAEGVAGPLATLAEKHILGVPEEDILGRREANPITHGLGQGAGLVGGMLTGTGEAALLGKAGSLASEAVMGAKALEGASLGFKVGSAAVTQAAEMAVLQGSDEVSKMILNDPATSAESAIANIGLSAALGGAGGAFMTGAVNPLWEASGAGAHLEKFGNAILDRLNGKAAIVAPEAIQQDLASLNIKPTALQQADLSDNVTAGKYIKDLTRGENNTMLAEREALQGQVADSVMEPLGTNLEDLRVYDDHVAGTDIKGRVMGRIKETFAPLWERAEARDAEAAVLKVADGERLTLRDRIMENGLEKSAGNQQIYKVYQDAADQVLNHETIAGFDTMDGQLRKSAKNYTQDSNISDAQRDIRSMIKGFKDSHIEKSAMEAEKSGIEGAAKAGKELIEERAAFNKDYAMAEKVREELGDHFGISSSNSREFMRQLDNAMTPEQVLKKFGIKNNVEGSRFLQEHFPEAFQEVIKAEQKSVLKPALLAAAKKGDAPIDVNKLNAIIQSARSGKNEYLNTVLPPEFIKRAEAGARVLGQMTKAKDSGTPAGMLGVLRGIGTSAMASVGWMTGHGVGSSALIAELAARGGHALPEAYKLGYLKLMASDTPFKADGFKAMVDFFHNTYKGETMLAKATSNVLKGGTQVLTSNLMPNEADRTKLDKQITKFQANPEAFTKTLQGQTGHYLPNHQEALSQTSTRAMQYLQNIKPQPHILGPLDKPVPPQPVEIARYNRALDIAQQPSVVLHHVKEGTLQRSDIADLNGMYPGLYKSMVQKLTNEMTNHHADGNPIPYHTKIGMALFMGTPVDSSMTPQNIIAAQPVPQGAPQQPQGAKMTAKGASAMGKGVKAYQTPLQAASADRSNRD